jgi:hypothetical protein
MMWRNMTRVQYGCPVCQNVFSPIDEVSADGHAPCPRCGSASALLAAATPSLGGEQESVEVSAWDAPMAASQTHATFGRSVMGDAAAAPGGAGGLPTGEGGVALVGLNADASLQATLSARMEALPPSTGQPAAGDAAPGTQADVPAPSALIARGGLFSSLLLNAPLSVAIFARRPSYNVGRFKSVKGVVLTV